MPDVKANIDIDLSDLKSQLEDISGSLEGMFSILGDQKDLVVENSAKMADALGGVGHAMQDIGKQTATESAGMLQSFNKVFDYYDDKLAELKRQGGFAELVGEMAPQQLAGVQDGLTKLKGSILSELPFGGLAGLMLLGAMRPEEVRAMGAQVGRAFQQAGQVGAKEMQKVGNITRELGVTLGKGPTGLGGEVAASAAAFAQAGIDIETVLEQKFSTPIKHSKGSILETSMALDALFKRGAGTSARQMADMTRDFNLDATKSATVVASIGLAARDSGTSVEAFSSSVMRSAQALRTQRVDITEVANAQLKFQKALKTKMPGVSDPYAAAYAERGIGQVSQGLSGMSVGLSAVLGERMTARGVGDEGKKTGLSAYYAMKEGFAGKGQTDEGKGMFTESVRELLSLAKENGRTVEEQRFFLEKMGFGFEGSKALMTIGEQAGAPGGSLEEAMKDKDNMKALNRSFSDKALETSDFQISLLRVQDGIAKIGTGLLRLMVTGIRMMAEMIKYVSSSSGSRERMSAELTIEALSKSSTAGVENILRGMDDIGGGSKKAFGVIAGSGPDDEEIAAKVEREHGTDIFDKPKTKFSVLDPSSYGHLLESTAAPTINKQKVQAELTRRVGKEIESSLKNIAGITSEQAKEVARVYKTAERKTGGKGEVAAAKLATKLGLSGSKEETESMLRNIEDVVSKQTMNIPGKGKVSFKVILQQTGYDKEKGTVVPS